MHILIAFPNINMLAAFLCLAVWLLSSNTCDASNPNLSRVMPRGVERGVRATLVFHGDRLSDSEEVFFYDDGFEVESLKVIAPKKVQVTLNIDPDCRLGEHLVQLRTRSGVSDFRIIHVEAYPSVSELEKELETASAPASAQLIKPLAYSDQHPDALGIVVAGRIKDEDHDWFAIDGSEGDRLSIEVVAMRLGDYCDTVLELVGPTGETIAIVDDTPTTKQDPFLSIQLPSDGRYLIHLSDAAGRGGNNNHYRLHVGNFPRPSIALPAVASPEESAKIVFMGDCDGPIERTLKLSREEVDHGGVLVSDRRGTTPTPVPFRLNDASQVSEAEPNDTTAQTTDSQPVPFTVSGCIDQRGDRDLYAIEATQGQRLHIEVFGHRIGSNIDSTVQVRRSDGRSIGNDANSRGFDSMLSFTVPKDGQYFIEVTDARSNFGPSYRYQLDVSIAEPSFSLNAAQFERYTQQRQQAAVHAGNRFAMLISADRQNVSGPIQLLDANLPGGIRMIARTMPAEANTMPVVFESTTTEHAATEQAVTEGRLIDLRAELIPDNASDEVAKLIGHFRNDAEMMRVQPNNMCMKFATADRLAVAVLEPAPFRIQLVSPAAPISQSGRANLTINVDRDDGFEAPVILRLPFRPPGVGARATLPIKSKQTTINYPINTNGKAAIGVWPICVTAVASNQHGMMVSTGLHDLEIIKPFVACKSDLVSGQAGAETTFECELEAQREFTGTATARLRGLPQHVSSPEQSFQSGDSSIPFTLAADADCTTGKNLSAMVEITVDHNGNPIVFDAGRILFRFSKPLVDPVAPAKRTAPPETKP